MAETASSIRALRQKTAKAEFSKTQGVREKIDEWLSDQVNGFYGNPVSYNIRSLYTGELALWPFILDEIKATYCSEAGGFRVEMSGELSESSKITFSEAPPKTAE
jgi:hypothetical protein